MELIMNVGLFLFIFGEIILLFSSREKEIKLGQKLVRIGVALIALVIIINFITNGGRIKFN